MDTRTISLISLATSAVSNALIERPARPDPEAPDAEWDEYWALVDDARERT